MKRLQKEYIQNKGSALLSCIYTILFISLIMASIILTNSIEVSKNKSSIIIPRIFTENRINEINYIEQTSLKGGLFPIYNDTLVVFVNNKTIEYANARGSFSFLFDYDKDENGRIYLYNLEVQGE